MDDKKLLTDSLNEFGVDVQVVLDRPNTNFDGAGTLYSLDISGLGLTQIPDLSIFPALSVIELGFNDLTKIEEETFKRNNRMMKISLVGNKLKTLPSDLFARQTALQQLALSRNQIEILPEQIFKRTVNLHTLLLNGNPLQSLPSSIFRLRNLRYLNLADAGRYSVTLHSLNEVQEFLTNAIN